MSRTETTKQYELRFVKENGDPYSMGFYDEPMDAFDTLAELRQQGYDYHLFEQTITREFSDWVDVTDRMPTPTAISTPNA